MQDNRSITIDHRLKEISPRREKTEIESVHSQKPRHKSAVRTRHVHEASFSKVPGPYDGSLYYLSPFDKAVLKKNNVVDKVVQLPGQRINYSFNVQSEGTDSPMLGNSANQSMMVDDTEDKQRRNRSLGPSFNKLRSVLPPRRDMMVERVILF